MSFLGDIGSLYMLVLIVLLIVGFGMITKGFFDYLLNLKDKNKAKTNGSDKSQSAGWFKLSMYSLAGILISLLILSFLPSTGTGEQMSTGNQSAANTSAHVHGASSSSGATGLTNSGNVGNLNSNSYSNNNYNQLQLQQQLIKIQNQINQLQTTLQTWNNQ